MRKTSWFVAWGIFVLLLLSSIGFRLYDVSGRLDHGFASYAADIVVVDLGILLPGALIALLVALFRRRGSSFAACFWSRLPFVFASVAALALVLASSPWWYPALDGETEMAGVDFETLGPEPGTDCFSVHDGDFESGLSRLSRSGGQQVEQDKIFRYKADLLVTWVSPCEYRLDNKEDTTSYVRVKILHVDLDGYECAYIRTNEPGRIEHLRLDRVK